MRPVLCERDVRILKIRGLRPENCGPARCGEKAALIPVRGRLNLCRMITQKMKYALKALLVLADEAGREKPEPLTIE